MEVRLRTSRVAAARLLSSALWLTCWANVAEATGFLDDIEIQRDVVGGEFSGHYADGKPWHEHYHADEKLIYTEAGRTVDGYWTLREGTFCTLYRGALSGGCWRLKRVGANCFEFYDAEATDLGTAPRTQWTARGWRKEKAPTCGAPHIS